MAPNRARLEREADRHIGNAARFQAAWQLDEALVETDRAIADVRAIADAWPGEPPVLSVLAGQLYNRATLRDTLGEYEDALSDAREAVGLYEALAEHDPQWDAFLADARARMARLLVRYDDRGKLRPYGGTGREPALAAVRTYERLASGGPGHEAGLARVRFCLGYVLSSLDGVDDAASILAYTAAVEGYRAMGDRLTPEDQGYYADAALQLLFGLVQSEAPATMLLGFAQEAVRCTEALFALGRNPRVNYARCLFVEGTARREVGDPGYGKSFANARFVISTLPRPLPRDLEEILRQLGE